MGTTTTSTTWKIWMTTNLIYVSSFVAAATVGDGVLIGVVPFIWLVVFQDACELLRGAVAWAAE